MLEPDNPDTSAPADPTPPPDAPAPRKRAPRKAAATALGEPATADSGEPAAPRKRAPRKAAARAEVETTTTAAGDDEHGATPAKKAARKRVAKKAAQPAEAASPEAAAAAVDAAPAEADAGDAAAAETPAKKTPRKRATKKAPTPADDAGGSADPVLAAPGVLFMAPPEKPNRRRRAPNTDAAAAAEPEPAGADLAAAEDAEDLTAEPEDVREAAIEQASGARRRRRRGRRGRGGAKAADTGEGTDTAPAEADEQPAGEPATAAEEAGEPGEAATHRRRKRRRAGASGEDEPDEPGTVTHVRAAKQDDGVRAVKGSTRLEAKRQRRRDGRETTRRRAPILSESEFLARREAVARVMAVRQNGDRTQIAVLEDDVLVEHYVTRASAVSYVGNVYLGRVQNVLPSMEAAFVDIGKGRNGVLYAGEVNWDAAGLEGKSRAIENALSPGDPVLVQVTKDPIGHKGARLTSQISLPGRFLVYVPGGGMTGISRRLPDTERHRLKTILKKIVPEDAGVIVRTAAEGAGEDELTRDVERLKAQWEAIEKQAKDGKAAPVLVHGEPDLATRVVRDVFNEDFSALVVQGEQAWQTVSEYVGSVAPDLAERVSRHTSDNDLFVELRVDEQLMKALDRKVWLPSGGSLVIDRTEAMTVIDVNTGKFVGAGGNLEQTVTRNNLEAAEEIVRQLRLRDVGGIVVIDFIDMVLESNRELVLRRLVECLGRDRTKHQVAEVTSLGLVQMTRKRVGEGLLEAFSETCEHCHGRGVIVHTEPVDKSGGGADEERPAGKGKRKRGGKAAAGAVEPPVDPATEEQRRAASAAIAAIHRAAAGEKDDGETAPGPVAQLAESLVAAARDATGQAEAGQSADVDSAPAAPAEPVAPVSEAAAADGAQPADAAEPVAGTGAAPARRRRRVASRPAGPPDPG